MGVTSQLVPNVIGCRFAEAGLMNCLNSLSTLAASFQLYWQNKTLEKIFLDLIFFLYLFDPKEIGLVKYVKCSLQEKKLHSSYTLDTE